MPGSLKLELQKLIQVLVSRNDMAYIEIVEVLHVT